MWDVSQRELENLWNQVEKRKKKRVENERAGERKSEEASRISGSKEKKWRGCTNDGYMCVVDKMQEKKKKETYGWKKRQRIRNHNLKIIP